MAILLAGVLLASASGGFLPHATAIGPTPLEVSDAGPSVVPLDSTPPTTTAEISGAVGANGWYNSPVIVTLTATDDVSEVASTEYQVNDTGFQPYEGAPFAVTAEGTNLVEFFSRDIAGNVETTQQVTVRIDSEPPTATGQLQGTLDASGWYRSAVTVTLTASDVTSGVNSLEYLLDGAEWQPYAPVFVIGEGSHTLEYRATDVSGLVDAHAVALPVDPTPPTCAAFTGGLEGDNGWWRSDVVLTLSCADMTSGLASIEYHVDSGAWNPYASPTSLGVADGSHTVGYRAWDEAGNVASERTVTVRVDREAPEVTITAPVPDIWSNSSSVLIQWTASDATSGADRFEVSVDGGSPQIVTGTEWQLEDLADGGHSVTVRAIDMAGNAGQTTITVGVDTRPPAISIASPAQGAIVTESHVRIQASTTDSTSGAALCLIRLDDGEPEPVSLPGSIAFDGLADGAHVVLIACADLAGNVAIARRSFTVITDPLNPSGPYGPWLLSGLAAIPIAIAVATFVRIRRSRTEEIPRTREESGEEPDDADLP